jgi:hypothetical protein
MRNIADVTTGDKPTAVDRSLFSSVSADKPLVKTYINNKYKTSSIMVCYNDL